MPVLFHERQRITFFWGKTIALAVFGLLTAAFTKQILLGSPFGTKPMGNTTLAVLFLLSFVVLLIVFLSTMVTTITKERITVSYFPIILRERAISWNDVSLAYTREYLPISEYGGWGAFRVNVSTARGLGQNRAINVKGNHGLQLVLKNGSKLLIGTQKLEELRKLEQVMD